MVVDGHSKEYEIERLYRQAALTLIGAGTSDFQKMTIGQSVLKGHKLKSAGSQPEGKGDP